MIVEFVGAPGSGKTTLIPAVHDELTRYGLEPRIADLDRVDGPRTRPGVAATWLSLLLANPRLTGRLLSLVHRDRRRVVSRRLLAVALRDRKVRRLGRSQAITLVDEGPFHRLLWAYSFYADPRDVVRGGSGIMMPDVFVVVDVNPEEALNRLAGRAKGSKLLDEPSDAAFIMINRYRQDVDLLLESVDVAIVRSGVASEIAKAIVEFPLRADT